MISFTNKHKKKDRRLSLSFYYVHNLSTFYSLLSSFLVSASSFASDLASASGFSAASASGFSSALVSAFSSDTASFSGVASVSSAFSTLASDSFLAAGSFLASTSAPLSALGSSVLPASTFVSSTGSVTGLSSLLPPLLLLRVVFFLALPASVSYTHLTLPTILR